MFFRLKEKCGEHNQNGKTYKPGDVVETEIDLTIHFGHKFELIEDTKSTSSKITKPNIDTPQDEDDKDKEDKSSSSSLNKHGKDVTDQFSDAEDIGVLVFEKVKTNGKWYTVVDPDDNSVLTKKNLRKGKVNDFLVSITEEDN